METRAHGGRSSTTAAYCCVWWITHVQVIANEASFGHMRYAAVVGLGLLPSKFDGVKPPLFPFAPLSACIHIECWAASRHTITTLFQWSAAFRRFVFIFGTRIMQPTSLARRSAAPRLCTDDSICAMSFRSCRICINPYHLCGSNICVKPSCRLRLGSSRRQARPLASQRCHRWHSSGSSP